MWPSCLWTTTRLPGEYWNGEMIANFIYSHFINVYLLLESCKFNICLLIHVLSLAETKISPTNLYSKNSVTHRRFKIRQCQDVFETSRIKFDIALINCFKIFFIFCLYFPLGFVLNLLSKIFIEDFVYVCTTIYSFLLVLNYVHPCISWSSINNNRI